MSCKTVRERVLDLALDERIGDPALRAHLDSCPGCRDALASRRVLLGAIDRVLVEELRQEPSPLLAARVRQALETEGQRTRAAWPAVRWTRWVPAATTLTLALVGGLAIRDRLGSSETAPLQPAPSPETIVSATGAVGNEADQADAGPQPVPPVVRPLRPEPGRLPRRHVGDMSRPAAGAAAFPEVLVPVGEMNAVLRLGAAAAARPRFVPAPEGGEDVANRAPEPVSIEEIEIAPLVLAPLEFAAPQPAAPTTL